MQMYVSIRLLQATSYASMLISEYLLEEWNRKQIQILFILKLKIVISQNARFISIQSHFVFMDLYFCQVVFILPLPRNLFYCLCAWRQIHFIILKANYIYIYIGHFSSHMTFTIHQVSVCVKDCGLFRLIQFSQNLLQSYQAAKHVFMYLAFCNATFQFDVEMI